MLKTNHWIKFKKGDPVYGYWKMRTKECEKLFEGILIEDPFTLRMPEFTDELMIQDGFKSLDDGLKNWFIPHYGWTRLEKFVVLRWKAVQFYGGNIK